MASQSQFKKTIPVATASHPDDARRYGVTRGVLLAVKLRTANSPAPAVTERISAEARKVVEKIASTGPATIVPREVAARAAEVSRIPGLLALRKSDTE
jgi:hypothetical protein